MTLQEIISRLEGYWASYGCVILPPYDVEKGAGTFNTATTLRSLGPEPWKVGYVEPSRRPTDGRYAQNPMRLYRHHQYQVIVKPAPSDSQDIYLESLRYLSIDPVEHDLRFVEDDWESPTLGAAGLGWQVWLDGLEITQFTYFQQMGGIQLDPVSLELTYGLERIAMFIQQKDNIFDLQWNQTMTYANLFKAYEEQFCAYSFELADTALHFELFEKYAAECKRALAAGQVFPAYDYMLRCSHTFNVLDARKAIGVNQRATYIARIRGLARRCCEEYMKMQGWSAS